ncbi:Nn.00g096880.m01.CDS01 [Neocucurbitaria sp. VM-36]
MLFLNTLLHILDTLSAMMRLLCTLVALVGIFCQGSASLLICALNILIEATVPPAENSSQYILYTPLFALHNLIYDAILPQLTNLSPEDQFALLRGRHFALLANAIIENTSSPIIERLGLKLPSHELIEELKRLPAVIVTPPDDGDRSPLAGEKGGKKLRFTKGLLAPPTRRKRLGKLAREAKKKFAKLTGGS